MATPFSTGSVRLDKADLHDLQRQRLPSKPQNQQNGRHEQPKRRLLRPFTVFALCIPLGYAFNWSLKRRNEGSSSADGFIKYTLSDKQEVSSTSSILTLKPTGSSEIQTDYETFERAITSVQFKQPQLQIARSYTLLPRMSGQDRDELSFFIRKEQNGEVSSYLHNLPIGSEVELRGLCADYILPKKVDRVLFLAGGTGIVPALQIVKELVWEADTRILWANRRREDCIGGINDTVEEKRWSLDSGTWTPYDPDFTLKRPPSNRKNSEGCTEEKASWLRELRG